MPLPNNNLPSSSQQWAREIEKQIAALNQAAAISRTNSVGRDAANDANIQNLSSLLLDQVELRTYAVEYPFAQGKSASIIGVAPGLEPDTIVDTSDLKININLSKPRNLLINYSSYYTVNTTFPNTTDRYTWNIGVEVYLNGVRVDYQNTSKAEYYTSAISLAPKSESGSINMVKIMSVSEGNHTISIKEFFGTSSNGGQTIMGTTGDSIIVTVIK